jgi:anti-sigma factor RsiW
MKIDVHPQTALIPYIRGQLAPDESEGVRLHLEGCAACRAETASLLATWEEVSARMEELPQPEWIAYRSELRRKLDARRCSRRRRRRWMLGIASLTAAGAAAAATLLLVVRPPTHALPPVEELALEQQLGSNDLGLLRNYPVVERLDLLENYDVIEHLNELSPAPREQHDSRS